MNLPFHRILISLVLLLVLLLGAALVVAAQPTYTSVDSAQTEPTLLPIFQTATALHAEDEITATPSSAPVSIDEIENYDGDYETIVAELQENGVIPLGGKLIYETNYAFFDGTGGFYTPLAEFRPHTNYMMSGELTFTASSDPDDVELCGFLTRVRTEGDFATGYIVTGFAGDGSPLLLDQADDFVVDLSFATYDLEESHYYTVVVLDNTVLIFVDGELVLANDELTPRQGSYGIVIDSEGFGARCEVDNVWIYELDNVWEDEEGVCGVTTSQSINLRAGPGTTYAVDGQTTANDILSVDGQFLAPDGFVWWRLTTENWVRSDLVDEMGSCEDLAPEIELEEE